MFSLQYLCIHQKTRKQLSIVEFEQVNAGWIPLFMMQGSGCLFQSLSPFVNIVTEEIISLARLQRPVILTD